MVVGYKLIRESFTTEVILDAEARSIVVHYLDGPFSYLENRWTLPPADIEELARSISISPTAFARACSSG